MTGVSPLRLYLLRGLYLLIFVGQGTIQWPALVQRGVVLPFWHGVGAAMLGSLALLCVLGIRYPLQMLPLMFFELTWKLIWVLAILLPKWSAGQIDAATAESAPSILMGVIVPLVIPWGYAIDHYVKKPADPWRLPTKVRREVGG